MTGEESKAKCDAIRQITLSHMKSSDLEFEKGWKFFRKRLSADLIFGIICAVETIPAKGYAA